MELKACMMDSFLDLCRAISEMDKKNMPASVNAKPDEESSAQEPLLRQPLTKEAVVTAELQKLGVCGYNTVGEKYLTEILIVYLDEAQNFWKTRKFLYGRFLSEMYQRLAQKHSKTPNAICTNCRYTMHQAWNIHNNYFRQCFFKTGFEDKCPDVSTFIFIVGTRISLSYWDMIYLQESEEEPCLR